MHTVITHNFQNHQDQLQTAKLLRAEMFGQIKGRLSKQGIVIPPVDLLIAATARVHGLTLVTHNTADFARVPDLPLADWLAG